MNTPSATPTGDGHRTIRVWDVPVRVFHWVLVVLLVTSVVTGQLGGNAMTWHMWSGYAILALVLFRVIWGIVGSHYARFADFVYGMRATLGYAGRLARLDPPPYAGHNPLGGWSVVLMLLCVAVQVVTGLFANDDIATEGPLVKHVSEATSTLLTRIHKLNINVLYVLVGVHVAAALFYLVVKRENLIGAMFTGMKRVPADSPYRDGRMASVWLALVLVIACAVVARVIVTW